MTKVFYNLAYPRVSYPRIKWEFNATAENLRQEPAKGQVLEIGAGHGHFIRYLARLAVPPSAIFATEFNDNAADILENGGVTVFQEHFSSKSLRFFAWQIRRYFLPFRCSNT